MSPSALVDQLQAAGIRLVIEGGALHAEVLPGVDLTAYAATIREHKPALAAELRLRTQIIAAAKADPFCRISYDALWCQWHKVSP